MAKYYFDDIVMLVLGLLPLGSGLAFWRSSSTSMRLLTVLLAVDTVLNIVMFTFAIYHINNLFFMHFYALFAYGLIALLFSYWHSPTVMRLMRLSIPILVVVYFFFLGTGIEVLDRPNKYTLSLVGMLVAVITLYTLYSTVSGEHDIAVYRQEKFWVSIGFFLSFSAASVAAASIPEHITSQLWLITTVLISISYLLYLKGFLCMRKSISSP